MAKPKFTAEQKVEIINAYKEGRIAYSQIKEVWKVILSEKIYPRTISDSRVRQKTFVYLAGLLDKGQFTVGACLTCFDCLAL